MDDLQKSLYSLWLSRLGLPRINRQLEFDFSAEEISQLRGLKIRDKCREIVNRHIDDLDPLHQLMLEGFAGAYHQNIFIRRTELDHQKLVQGVETMAASDDVIPLFTASTGQYGVRRLFVLLGQVQFLEPAGDTFQLRTDTIQIAAFVQVLRGHLVAGTLKMELEDWESVLGVEIFRILNRVTAESAKNKLLSHIRSKIEPQVFEAIDFSLKARDLMRHENVTTYSGHRPQYNRGLPVAEAAWKTLGALRQKRSGLREAWKEKFDELTASESLGKCELVFDEQVFGIPRGSKFYLVPLKGEISVSTQNEPGATDALLDFIIS